MHKIYFLSSCSTCQRILKEIQPGKEVEMQDIKTAKITPQQLDEMAKMAGSYEKLFSRVAMKYKSMGLKEKNLEEKDYRNLILDEYTFLKRPVILFNNKIFIGNSPSNIQELKNELARKL